MKFASNSKPLSYLQLHAVEVAHEIIASREPMLITQDGEPKLVLMDIRTFQENEQTLALLKILAAGNREFENGQFRSATDVFADMDKDEG